MFFLSFLINHRMFGLLLCCDGKLKAHERQHFVHSYFHDSRHCTVTAEKLLLTASHLYGAINHREISGKTVCKVWVCCILGSFCCILMFGCVKKLSKNIWHFDVILSTFKGNGSKLPAFLPQSFLMAESPKKSSLMRKGTDRAKSPKKAWWKLPKSAIKDPNFESKTGCMQTLWISDFHLKIWKSENSRKNLFRQNHSFSFREWCRVDTRHENAKGIVFWVPSWARSCWSPQMIPSPQRHRRCEWFQRTLPTVRARKLGSE